MMARMADPEDVALEVEFRREATEGLDAVERVLLVEGKRDHAAVGTLFRLIHTIKGNAGFFGLNTVVHAAHTLEALLDVLRQARKELEDAHVDEILRGVDQIRVMVAGNTPSAPPVATPPVVVANARAQPSRERSFAHYLLDSKQLSEQALLEAVWERGRRTITEVQLLIEEAGLNPTDCLRVLLHADECRMSVLGAAELLGLTNGCSADQLRYLQMARRPTMATVLVDLGLASKGQVLRWMRAYASGGN